MYKRKFNQRIPNLKTTLLSTEVRYVNNQRKKYSVINRKIRPRHNFKFNYRQQLN